MYPKYRPFLAALIIAFAPTIEAENRSLLITVVAGDTLSSIANRYLGAANRWGDLALLNKLKDPNKLSVGQHLLIPLSASISKNPYACNDQIFASYKSRQNISLPAEGSNNSGSAFIVSTDSQGTSVSVLSGSAAVIVEGTTIMVPKGKVAHSSKKGCVYDIEPSLKS